MPDLPGYDDWLDNYGIPGIYEGDDYCSECGMPWEEPHREDCTQIGDND